MMKLTSLKKKCSSLLLIIFVILSSTCFIIFLNHNHYIYSPVNEKSTIRELKGPKIPLTAAQESFTTIWLKNPRFDDDPIEPTWYSEVDGDLSDVEAISDPVSNYVNLSTLGDSNTFRIDDPLSDANWTAYKNPKLPILPDRYEINSSGCYATHTWDENVNQTRNRPSVHWKQNINMPVNMSDYIITSVSLEVNFTANVTVSPRTGGGIDRLGDPLEWNDDYSTGDYAEFYVLLSDVEESFEPIQVAYNNTGLGHLGEDSRAISSFSDTPMDVVPENVLKSILTSALEKDGYNFTITLGIDIYCEDNEYGVDVDRWNSTIIRSFNLTLTYEKKIDQYTSVSWNQNSDKISDISTDTVIVNEANLNFKYKIDKNWTDSSPNSEIRVFINNNKLSETIKLSKANQSFQEAKDGGFNITSLIPYNTDIKFSIQLYIADEFGLNKTRTISIDDIYLNISYTVIFPDTQTNLQVSFNGVNKTLNPIFEVPRNTTLNITVRYPDDNGAHIPYATIQLSGNLTGTLTENRNFGQYTILIDSGELNVGEHRFNIVAHRINYEARKISPILFVMRSPVLDLELFFNEENKTSDPFFDIAINKLLNITVKYKDLTGTHIPNATVQLTGDGIEEYLNEDPMLEQYSIIINATIKLTLGQNSLIIRAEETNFQEEIINSMVILRRINAEIIPVLGSNKIKITPGGDAPILIYIYDTDFDKRIQGAAVEVITYVWENGNGILTDDNNDGIYEALIKNVPEGTHSLIINVFGSNIYNFASYEMLIITGVNQGGLLLFQVLLTIFLITSVGLGGYLYVYQKILIFPKPVRKVRKFQRTLRKIKAPHVDILRRKKAFASTYKEELKKSSRFLKGKPTTEITEMEKVSKNVPKIDQNELKNDTAKSQNMNKSSKQFLNKKKIHNNKFKTRIRKFWYRTIKYNKSWKFSIIFLVLILNLLIFSQFMNLNSFNSSKNEKLGKVRASGQDSYTEQWLNNTSFDAPLYPPWYSKIEGDLSDVDATSGLDYANFDIIGDSGILTIDDPLNDGNWIPFNNPKFPISPQNNWSNSEGLWVSHTWDEDVDQTLNTPSIHWKRNITTFPINMSDYIITSASLEVNFSAIVTTTPLGGGGIDTPRDGIAQFGIGDSVTFYVLISDLENENIYQVAYNKTRYLGQDSPAISSYTDIPLEVIPEEILISYLTSVLEGDGVNFSITLGIDIYCEDNVPGGDEDNWNSLTLRVFNLTFTYEKKIDQFNSVSWNQDADNISELSNDPFIIDEAIINFKYKINDTWPISYPNSEIRVLISDNLHTETIKLSTATLSFQEAKLGGFDVTSLITDDVNLSIQLFMADDNIGLNRPISISIDNVTLDITYTVIFPDIETNLYLFLNNEEKTLDPNIELDVEEQLNITVKYLSNTGVHIPNAKIVLSGNYTGNFTENSILGQYSILITTDTDDIGVNFLTIAAQAEDFITQRISSTVTVRKIDVEDLQLFLNSENKTLDPYVELIYGEELNITVKYLDISGAHIPSATVKLISERLTKDLEENHTLGQYSGKINTSERLKIGNNYLLIEAQEANLQTKTIDLRVSIRKINLEINTVSGSNTIEITPGENITISVNLINTDFGGMIQGAIITYIWDNGNGILTDSDNDGIYEAFIENIPSGTHSIEISAFVGDEYFANDYELVLTSSKLGEDPTLFQILVIITSIIVAVLAIYVVMYQRYLKYPKPVRKVRKYKRTLRKKTAPSTNITNRKNAFRSLYKDEVKPISSKVKSKSSEITTEQKSKPVESNLESEELISSSLEKKIELDKIIDDSSKSNSKSNNT